MVVHPSHHRLYSLKHVRTLSSVLTRMVLLSQLATVVFVLACSMPGIAALRVHASPHAQRRVCNPQRLRTTTTLALLPSAEKCVPMDDQILIDLQSAPDKTQTGGHAAVPS